MPSTRHSALAAVLADLRCPVCDTPIRLTSERLRCERRHSFDIARQGYVNLSTGGRHPGTADSAPMITARDQFLTSGHYAPIADTLQSITAQFDPQTSPGLIVDLAGGTGYYLAHLLDALPHRHGLCIDLSAPALRRAARAHPRLAALGRDVWQRLPLAEHSVAIVISVFGPRNLPEVARILASTGVFVVATPTTHHLQELIGPLGMVTVDRNKSERLASDLHHFHQLDTQDLTYLMSLSHTDIAALVSMGPSAHHIPPPVLTQRLQVLPDPTAVTASARIAVYRVSEPTASPRRGEAAVERGRYE